MSGGGISLIDFEKFRCYCLLSRSVGFAFCISAFGRFWSDFRHLFGSGMVHLQIEGGQVSVDSTIDLHTQDYGAAPDTSINL